jgi:hypothetical protein
MGHEADAKWAPQEEQVPVPSVVVPSVVVEQGEAQVSSMSMERGEVASTLGSSRGSLDWDAILEVAAATGLPRQEKAPKGLPRQEQVTAGAWRRKHVGAPPCAFVRHRRTRAESGLRQRRDVAASSG